MIYKIIVHVFLGECGSWNGKNKSLCYGSSYLIHAPRYRRYHDASMRIGIKNQRLSLPTATGWRVPKSIVVKLENIKVDEDRGFTERRKDKIFKKIDDRRRKFNNSYKYNANKKVY